MMQMIIGSMTMISAVIIGFILYKTLENRILRFCVWFTLAEFCIQFSGYFYVIVTGIRDNIFIYNINIFSEYGFYLIIFYGSVKSNLARKATFSLFVIFVLLYIYNLFISTPFTIRHSVYNVLMSNIGEFFTLLGCFIFLIEMLVSEEEVNFATIPMFWITTGIMIEVVGIFIFLAFSSYIIRNNLDPVGAIYGLIMTVCNLIQYGFFTLGFLAKRIWKDNSL